MNELSFYRFVKYKLKRVFDSENNLIDVNFFPRKEINHFVNRSTSNVMIIAIVRYQDGQLPSVQFKYNVPTFTKISY